MHRSDIVNFEAVGWCRNTGCLASVRCCLVFSKVNRVPLSSIERIARRSPLKALLIIIVTSGTCSLRLIIGPCGCLCNSRLLLAWLVLLLQPRRRRKALLQPDTNYRNQRNTNIRVFGSTRRGRQMPQSTNNRKRKKETVLSGIWEALREF